MSSENFKLKLSINGLEIEVCGDKPFVESKFKELETNYVKQKDRSVLSLNLEGDEQNSNKTKPSIIDFVNTKKPKSKATELMPALVYYHKHFDGIDKFNEEDVKNLYRRYDISKRPKNVYQAILDINRNKGYFESVIKEKGYFRLTEAGEHFVEVKLLKNN